MGIVERAAQIRTGRTTVTEVVEDCLDAIALRREVDAALDGRDALVLPTLPTPAPPSGAEQVTLGEVTMDVRTAALRLTQLFDLTGHPALTIPSEPTADGLPCGVQLVGAYGRTLELVELGMVQEARIRG